MRSIKELSMDLRIEQAESQKKQSTEVAEAIIDELFNDLSDIFISFKPTRDDLRRIKAQWLIGFAEQKITPSMLNTGLKRARGMDRSFFPTIGEFCSWCKPRLSDFNLSASELLNEVIRYKALQKFGDAHAKPLVIAVCSVIDYGQLRVMREDQALKHIETKALNLLSTGYNPDNVSHENERVEQKEIKPPVYQCNKEDPRVARIIERINKIRAIK